MRLNKLTDKDANLFAKYLRLAEHELSVYAFENIYIWKNLYNIRWAIINDSLCVFFQDKIGCFLYLPPLGNGRNCFAIKKSFEIMDKFNKNQDVSRIENIEEKDAIFYQNLGYDSEIKSYDYLCARLDLVNLRGDKFKSKRACINYFTKHNKFEYLGFLKNYSDDCLALYNLWMGQRKEKIKDHIYRGMLKDSLSCLKILLRDCQYLNITGKLLKIDNAIKAFTFGFKLNKDTFCILYEITDLNIKGLAQFIFRKFCRGLKDYKYINIMDDSGLENLKKVKLSYHPQSLVPAYIARRKNGSLTA